MIVQEWPKTINANGGIVCNPTPQQCIDAGYELAIPPTAEEIAQAEAQMAQVEADRREAIRLSEIANAERMVAVEQLRQDYRNAVAQFCTLAGLPVVNKFEDTSTMQSAIVTANAGGNIQQILGLTQTALALQNIITELRRKDGDDAWERI